MALSISDIQLFSELFEGNMSYYGMTTLTGVNKETGKVEADCKLVRREVNDALYQRHLRGEISLGIAPITEDGLCYFGALDIDEKIDENLIIDAIYRIGFPILPFHSKSNHLHLFVFFDGGATPKEVRTLLRRYVLLFGLPYNVEIFPKQSAKRDGTTYSWINLPYYNAESTDIRKLIDKDYTSLSLHNALTRISVNRLTIADHQSFLDNYEWIDAPPCLQASLTLQDVTPGHRNEWLFSLGVYIKLKYGETMEAEDKIKEINNALPSPLPAKELEATILTSLRKETYFYKCSSMAYCNKSACRKGNFGFNTDQSTGLEYGQMTQILTDPPYYTWSVSGKLLIFYSEADLINQNQFRQLCLRHLHLLPKKVNDEIWSTIVTKALNNVVVEQTSKVGDFTEGSTLLTLLNDYFGYRRHGDNIETVKLGRVYKDGDHYWFSAQHLLNYLKEQKDFKGVNNVELRARIIDMGGNKQSNALWTIPCSSVDVLEKPNIDNINMDDPDSIVNYQDF